MAGGKKKEVLTLEERLQAALVPESEQPYQVPGNWRWVYFKEISKIRTGKKDANYGSEDGEYPFFTCASRPIRCHGYSFECNAILLAGNGDINNITRYNGKFEAYQRTYVVEAIAPVNIDYVYYWFKYRWFDFNADKMFGTAIPYIRLGNLHEFPIPIPPVLQQQHIVERIESLFTKLEEAKQKVQDTLDGFETRKAAILYEAFCGALTAQWRKEHGAGREEWENTFIKNICHEIKVGIVIKPSQYYTTEKKGIPAFRSANVREFHIDNFDWVYLNEKGHMQNARSIVHTGDVLIVRSGNPGTACVVTEEFDGYNAIDILIAVPNANKVNSKFLCAYTNSPVCRQLIAKNKRGMALAHFNVGSYSKLPIFLPSVSEQNEIVRILDDLLAKEQQAKEAAEDVLEQIDLIKKSILARAFRGELGTNDSAEESSLELIKQILSETIASDNILKQRTTDRIEVKFVPKTILEALAGGVRLTPEDLKSETGLQIDEFYAQLKELIDNDKIIETRMDGESYLEAAHADRQTEN